MSKTCSDPRRLALHGATMGTRWSALCHVTPGFDPARLQAGLQAAVDEVDRQMSVWKPASDLMRLNAAPVGVWQPVPAQLMAVLRLGLRIGRDSGGAFDIGMGDATAAWGFGPRPVRPQAIRAALARPRRPAHELLELEPQHQRLRKLAPVTLDLNGIAKGYGVDRLAGVLAAHGIETGLVGIDGEMRAMGLRPDGRAWAIAVESPERHRRAAQAMLELHDAAVATSGDYRHWVEVSGRRLAHSMDPRRGAPLPAPPASVTVLAASCAEADAWATALTVLGETEGAALAARRGLAALFLLREGGGLRARAVGAPFAGQATGSSALAVRAADIASSTRSASAGSKSVL
ncbi:FAD:protein FMN transferase [Paracoccus sp. (in: a-proteobacteria)]|uniref:FAD:protein FMN transferase n=1 Tax=Paracoccus sp. TaxID=267 RepID=UPI00321FEA8F